MDTASLSMPAGQRGATLLRQVRAFAASFRWALEVRRRCDREAAAGRRLDGAAIRRIVGEVDDWIARR